MCRDGAFLWDSLAVCDLCVLSRSRVLGMLLRGCGLGKSDPRFFLVLPMAAPDCWKLHNN